jgi:hypothetical protein
MKILTFAHLSYVVLLTSISANLSFAAEPSTQWMPSAVSVRYENDSFGDTDENYTNGISLAVTASGKGLLGGLWNLFGDVEGTRSSTYEATQLMFTPTDLDRTDPDPSDRPYAGLTYLGLTTNLQRENSLHSLKLMAGVVGPASLTEDSQKFVHHVFKFKEPNGWRYQIKNEPIFNVLYEYRHRYLLTPGDAVVGIELIPMTGGFLGNYLIQAETNLQCRIGYHLPNDFGATVLRGNGYLPFSLESSTPRTWGFYAFAGGGANLVARNITLDGNTFSRSRSVDKRLFLPTAEFGVSLWTRWFQTTFSYVMWGREFYGQPRREDYGSMLFTWFL